jgi:hypothetical protein
MPQARVESIESLKHLKVAILKFAEEANVAVANADSEVNRVMIWLQNEQCQYWESQHRKRSEVVGRCREAVRMKKFFKDSTGRQQSAIDEEKALQLALRRLQEAEEKSIAIRKAIKKLEREIPLYKGSVQRFATNVQVDLPASAALLDGLLDTLEQYTSLAAPTEVTSDAGSTASQPMTRSTDAINKDNPDEKDASDSEDESTQPI